MTYARLAAALLATTVLILAALISPKFEELDVPLRIAVHYFIWAGVLLGAFLVLSTHDESDSPSYWRERPYAKRFRLVMYLCGASAWSFGAAHILDHFRIPGGEGALMGVLFLLSSVVAEVSHNAQPPGGEKKAPLGRKLTFSDFVQGIGGLLLIFFILSIVIVFLIVFGSLIYGLFVKWFRG